MTTVEASALDTAYAFAGRDFGLFIGGEWVASVSGERVPVISPIDQGTLGSLALAAAEDVGNAVAAATRAQAEWIARPVQDRMNALHTLSRRIHEHAEEIALLDTVDAGLPLKYMRLDSTGGGNSFTYFAGLMPELRGDVFPTVGRSFAYSRREPYGVVGQITAFNHPFSFAAHAVSAPLAAGNAVILKPADKASLSALRLAELSKGLLPDGLLNVLTGGIPAGQAISEHPGIPRVHLTGSIPAGRAVVRAGAEYLKHVSLELGGKNPLIITADAELEHAAEVAVRGMNYRGQSSQSCQSTTRVLVHQSIYDAFTQQLISEVQKVRIGDPRDPETEMGPLAFVEHRRRVGSYIELGQAEGARMLCGGPADDLPGGNYIRPTIFADVTPDMTIAREEIFGPVMSVMPWSTEEEVVALANSLEFGLTARVESGSLATSMLLAERLESGLIWINDQGVRTVGVPFGGFKSSGLGSQGSIDELQSYTRTKAIYAGLD